MRSCSRLPVISVLTLIALAVALAAPASSGEPLMLWQSGFQRSHPLVGRIWLSAEARFVEPEELAAQAAESEILLLGEKHDNPDHHRLQAWLLEEVAARRGKPPLVVFEAIDEDQRAALEAHLASHPQDSQGLGEAIAWDERGWPDWSHYRPLAEIALRSGGTLVPGSLPRASLRALGREGSSALEPRWSALAAPEARLPLELREDLGRDIAEGHCDMLPDAAVESLTQVQEVKDAYMAEALLKTLRDRPSGLAVLVAGNGHVRRDRGVPWHLSRRAPGQRLFVFVPIEVAAGATRVADYDRGPLPFDAVWFTPRSDDQDPCARFRKQLRRAAEEQGGPAPASKPEAVR